MKILALNGSPRRDSDTWKMTSSFLSGIQEADPETKIQTFRTIELKIQPCQGCFGCWHQKNHRCVQQDEMNGILALMEDSDFVVWSFPLYFFSMPAPLKNVLDRTIALHSSHMEKKDGKIVLTNYEGQKLPKNFVLSGCGFPAWDGNFKPLSCLVDNAFGPMTQRIFVTETPLLHQEAAKPLTEPFLAAFHDAGKEFIQNNGLLSEKTIEKLMTPLLPPDVYFQLANERHANY